MRTSSKQILINAGVRWKFAWYPEVCKVCGDHLHLDVMYGVNKRIGDVKPSFFVCRTCFLSKEEVYDMFFPEKPTPQGVLERNRERALTKERERVSVAVRGLNEIVAQSAKAEWQPATEQFVMETVVTAENALREVEEV